MVAHKSIHRLNLFHTFSQRANNCVANIIPCVHLSLQCFFTDNLFRVINSDKSSVSDPPGTMTKEARTSSPHKKTKHTTTPLIYLWAQFKPRPSLPEHNVWRSISAHFAEPTLRRHKGTCQKNPTECHLSLDRRQLRESTIREISIHQTDDNAVGRLP